MILIQAVFTHHKPIANFKNQITPRITPTNKSAANNPSAPKKMETKIDISASYEGLMCSISVISVFMDME